MIRRTRDPVKRRVVINMPRQKKEDTSKVTQEEYRQLQREIEQHSIAIRKLNDLSIELTDPDLKALVAKNIAQEEKEIIALNRKQLRANGHGFLAAPMALFAKIETAHWLE